ncbi:hypothetical protein [Tahibacter amnicola]|uniref:Uncharacterized protein n=1 Tax=Tahibacter amnicola TaxID=2976241 RepID=A0ABY6BEC0_9GAMM|nr:hypothetical protein [Tahibacter amnicola]UXI68374.1 hypothetical protein N4264_01600 [Tahibacter amnicola]
MRRRRWPAQLFVFVAVVLTTTTAHASWQSILAMIRNLMSEAAAWAGSAMQTAISAKQKTDIFVNSQQMLANSIKALDGYERTLRAALDFHPTVGQPASVKCTSQMEHTFIVESQAQAEIDASRLLATFSTTRVGSAMEGEAQIWSMHRQVYCSLDEAEQGLCTLSPNGMQSWDVDYAGAFSGPTLAPEGELAAYAYASMLADQRADAIIDCMTPDCAAASLQQLGATAQASMAAASIVSQATERRVPVLTGNQ